MRKTIRSIMIGILCVVLCCGGTVYAEGINENSAKLSIQNSNVFLRLKGDFELTYDEAKGESIDGQYALLLFAKAEYQNKDAWICIYREYIKGTELADKYEGRNEKGQIEDVPIVDDMAVKLFKKEDGAWKESISLTENRQKASNPNYNVLIDESDESGKKLSTEMEQFYLMMPDDNTILPLNLAKWLYGIELENQENRVIIRTDDEMSSPSPVLFVVQKETASQLILQKNINKLVIADTKKDNETETEATRENEAGTEAGTETTTENEAGTEAATEAETGSETETELTTETDYELENDGLAKEKPEEVTEKVTEGTTEGATEETTEKATEKVTEGTTEEATEEITEKATEAVQEVLAGAITESVTEPATESKTESVTEKTTEPASESATEAVTEEVTEEATEPITEAVTEEVAQLATEGTAIEATNTTSVEEKPAAGNSNTILILVLVLLILVVIVGVIWYSKLRKSVESGKKRKIYVDDDNEDTVNPTKMQSIPQNGLVIRGAVVNNKGRVRKNNEDNFYLNGTYMHRNEIDKGASVAGSSRDAVQLYAVCDGMGGIDAGEEASYRAVKELAARKQDHGKLLNATELTTVLREISDQIYQEAVQRGQKSGSTIVLMAVAAEQVIFANVGDSRIYRFRDKKLTQISKDHSKVQRMIAMGILTPEQAKTDPARHVITQYMGMPSDTKISPYIVADEQLCQNDVYILCSDGLTDMVEDTQIEAILREKKNPQEAVQELFKAAMNNGGRDNVTIMLLYL